MKNFLKDTLTKIFISQARAILKRHKPIIVAVVGSVGKTSTKLAIATVLKQKYRVQYQEGNYNVPLTVPFVITGQSLPSLTNPFGWLKAWLNGQKYLVGKFPYDVVVLELGTDKPGDILDFGKFLNPDISVVTAISEEHMEFFENLEKVAEEELTIAQYSKQIIYGKDTVNKDYVELFVPKETIKFTFGFINGTDYKMSAIRNSHQAFQLSVNMANDSMVETDVAVASKHGLNSIGAAVAVADKLGLTPLQIKKGINSVKPVPGRMRLFEGINNSIIIDDSYNSSPIAAEAALKTLYELKAPQKIAILGSMNELGAVSRIAHQSIGQLCTPDKLDLLITLGEDANNITAKSAEEQGCRVIRTSDPIKAGKVAFQNASEGAIILVKGSQNRVFSEEATKQLLANPADINNLVRQSDFWLAKKAAQFGYQE
jgi:UDP-N-acetylmuramoyl-tripeptide--D-alanyl-D-alanine ligase